MRAVGLVGVRTVSVTDAVCRGVIVRRLRMRADAEIPEEWRVVKD